MAVRMRLLSSDLRTQAASGAVYDHECDACRFEGTISEGISFCNVCREFLCGECKRVHKKSRATRDHDLVDGDSLHEVRSQEPPQAFEFCLKHPGNIVDFFCATHDSVFCADCRVLTHGSCRYIKSVSAASAEIQSSKEADKFTAKIKSMNDRIQYLYEEKNGNLVKFDKDQQNLLQEITEIRDAINASLDMLEKDMRQTVISTVTKETNKLQDDLSTLNTIKSSLDGYMTILDSAKSTSSNEKIFIAMKRACLQELEAPLDAFDEEQFIIQMEFTAHPLLDEILSSLQSFGSLETKFIKRPPNMLPASLRDRSLVKVAERDVEQHGEEYFCSIPGCVFLPSGGSLLCDFDNNKVKLLNKEMKIHADKTLSSGPVGVSMFTEREVVVSLPDEKKLQYVTVPGLKPGRKVKIGRPCFGLAVHKDQIFVTCHDNPGNAEILVVTKNGAIQRRIGKTDDGNYMYSPYYIAVDAWGEKIYVSDWDPHSVTCLTMEGGPVYRCVLDGALGPYSLLVDSEGGVLVCSEDFSTASLQFLTPEGNHYRTLITWPRETWSPLALCYRSRDRSLLLGMRENNKMLVYRFE